MTEKALVFALNDLVFVPDAEAGYLPAQVIQEFTAGAEGKVRLTMGGTAERSVSKEESKKVERMDAQSYKDVPDMINLKMLNEASLLYNLRLRYFAEPKMKIYTNIGAILVAINPFMDLGLYNPDSEDKYLNAGDGLNHMPPHIFKVAEAAFMNMKIQDKDQSCVITGESGAGKTETTKRFLQYVSEKSRRNRDAFGGEMGLDTEKLRSQILDSNPFMEAFGNAKTLRNDNSSRFGKLIEMFFETGKGVVVGAQITNYLLEKSRVVKVGKGERNYHIFYQLCDAAANTHPELKKKYHLQTADQFVYCLGDNKNLLELTIEGETDSQIFEETKEAMKKLNMTPEEIDTTFTICSGLLHLGNISFTGQNKDLAELAEGVAETALQNAADLLGVESPVLAKAIVYRQLTADIEKQHTVQEAESARDALAKFVYEKLFDWLILKMNQAMAQKPAGGRATSSPRVLGVLDIFGFETFEINSFEQMCINFCNEKLQAFFNLHVFKKEQAEYAEDEIDVAKIGFYDNQGVIDAIEVGPKAVMIVTDDLSGLESATDDKLLKRILNHAVQMNAKDAHQRFLFIPKVQEMRKKPHLKDAFTIKHFAGFVHYNIQGFLEKNKDTLRKDIRMCVVGSSIELLSSFFPGGGDGETGRQGKYKNTLGTKFRQSLQRLMDRLDLTTPQFVRCIKPNDAKSSNMFDPKKTFKQLNEAGLVEVCKIRKLGYPVKKTHKEFMNDYLCLDKSAKDCKDLCAKLKEKGILYETNHSPNWQVGRTKVFMRSEQLYELDKRRGEALAEVIEILHNFGRKAVFRLKIKQALVALKKIKAGIRSKDPEVLNEGLQFFIEKGPIFAKLPIVLEGLEIMKDLQVQLDLVTELKAAMDAHDFSTIKVKLLVAENLKLKDHPVVKEAANMLENMETEKNVRERLEDAIGAQNVEKLESAIAYATENGFGTSKQCQSAERQLKTLKERETRLEMLRTELGKETLDVDTLARLVEELRDCGLGDDHPLVMEAARRGDLILEKNKKREKKTATLEKQLRKQLKARNLDKLKDLVDVAVTLQYTGELLTEAVDMMKNLQQRQELLDEVSNASRVLREKSKLPDGITEADLVPLNHAIKTACSVPRLMLEEEIQVIEGKRLIEQMRDQIQVQQEVTVALKKDNQQAYYKMLEKVQSLGLQTREADQLVQKVREFEMLKAKAEAITNQERVVQLKENLRVPSKNERRKHLIARIKKMYSKDFNAAMKRAWKSQDLAMRNYYKVRSDADFVSKERSSKKVMRKNMKHAYEQSNPLSKSLLEMDDLQERKALQISETINRFCDGLSGSRKDSMESAMNFVVELGICDPILADEIYIQLAKHLTANPNALSKTKAWHLCCLCATYFGCSDRFLPYMLAFLQNSVGDAGLEGNYAKYVIAQLSSSLRFDPREVGYKPGSEEVRAFFERPPVLVQLEMVDGSRKDIPIPPDFSLQDAAPVIRKGTKVMIDLRNPEWAMYIRATVKPPKLTWKTRLENFYRHYKPENLGNVDQILAYYKGHEQSLFDDLTSTSNYGPEPTPVTLTSGKQLKSSRSQRTSSKAGSTKGSNKTTGTTPVQELEDIFDDDKSEFSVSSKSSVGSAISKVGSVVSKMFRRVRGLSTAQVEDLDVPNPTIAWPLPWWVKIGNVMNSLYEQNLVPVITYKRRICKMKGRPDENLYLQLQRDFLDGILAPTTHGENAKLSVIILCVRLLKAKKTIPFGDRAKLLKAGLLKCIPRRLRKQHKHNEQWLDAYVEVAAEKSLDLKDHDFRELQNLFFTECVKLPTYGMSFFFAQILKGNVKSYIARAQTAEDEGSVKIGINQNEIAFFKGGVKHKSYSILDLQKYWVDGTTFSFKMKKGKKAQQAEGDYDMPLGDGPGLQRKKSLGGKFFGTMKNAAKNMFGGKSETIQLYTLQPREMFDLIYLFKHLPKGEDE